MIGDWCQKGAEGTEVIDRFQSSDSLDRWRVDQKTKTSFHFALRLTLAEVESSHHKNAWSILFHKAESIGWSEVREARRERPLFKLRCDGRC